jgi:2-amino-4-hydroxy-6-hydroxymethyldihydropteridine diphosphokinase
MTVFIAIGSNLATPSGPPRATCEAALAALADEGVVVRRRSRWYESAPEPPSDQPWYVNGVAEVETELSPAALLAALHRIEAAFGRPSPGERVRNAARGLDLDLLCYDGWVENSPGGPVLPHPRMTARAFVLLPLRELAPDWRHPVTGQGIEALIAALPAGSVARPIE